MRNPSAVERLARRLNYVGAALILATLVAFVWAVGFTEGVSGLLDGIIIAALGFFVPAVATFWVAWIITVAAADHPAQARPAPVAKRGRRAWEITRNYTVAIVLVLTAHLMREWLTPLIGNWAPFSTLYLAVVASAWLGGMGPAVLATGIGIPLIWRTFDVYPAAPSPGAGELVATALFLSVSLACAGVTSALRVSRNSIQLLHEELRGAGATLDESENRFRALADGSTTLMWLSNEDNDRVWFNKAWLDFTGRSLEQELGDGWMQSIHPDDVQRCRTRYREGLDRQESFTAVFRLLSHDGTYRRVQDDVSPRWLPNRRFAGFVGHCVEVNVGRGRISAATEAGIAAGAG